MIKKYIYKFKKAFADLSYKKKAQISSQHKVVSFTFDDVPLSGLKNGTTILEKNGKRGTFYFALSFLDGEKGDANMYTEEDFKKCVEAGHEAACHTYSHMHLFDTSNKEFIINDLNHNQSVLSRIIPEEHFQNFSYPYGEQTRLAKSILTKKYQTSRSNDSGINVGNVDLNNLKSCRLYEKDFSLSDIDSILETFSDKGGWLIFYTHDVQDDYSIYGCSESYLDSVVKKCIDKGFEILTVKDMVHQLKP